MEFTEFLNAYSSLIQALATVVLVILTSYYVRQVKRSAIELEKTRKSEFIPILSPRIEARDTSTLDVYLSNIGRGIAQHPRVTLPFVDPKDAGEVIVSGQENVLVTLENVGTPEVLELPVEKRKLIIEYGDIFGRIIRTEVHLQAEEAEDGELTKERLGLAEWEIVFPHDEV